MPRPQLKRGFPSYQYDILNIIGLKIFENKKAPCGVIPQGAFACVCQRLVKHRFDFRLCLWVAVHAIGDVALAVSEGAVDGGVAFLLATLATPHSLKEEVHCLFAGSVVLPLSVAVNVHAFGAVEVDGGGVLFHGVTPVIGGWI